MKEHKSSLRLFLVIIVIFCSCSLSFISFAAVPVWSVDFENGFNASSGALRILEGDTLNPFDANKPLCLFVDPFNPDNDEVRVGNTTAKALLRYEGVDSSVCGPSGTVTLDFRVTDTTYPKVTTIFFCPDKAQTSHDWWFIGMVNPYRVVARSEVKNLGEVSYYGETAGNVPFSLGWHTMKFEWKQTRAEDPSKYIREKADIKLYVDDVLLINQSNVNWTGSGNRNINVGSYIASNNYLGTSSGTSKIMLDNIQIFGPEAVCGDIGTQYLTGDLNHDCYINFLDLAQFATNWMDDYSDLEPLASEWLWCTDLAERACDSYWHTEPITLVQNEVSVGINTPYTINFTAPHSKGKYYLSIDGRLLVPGGIHKGGANPCPKYFVNNKVVYGPEYVVNVPDGRDTGAFNGSRMPRTAGAERWYLVMNNLDFNPMISESQPACLGNWPYRIVLDVSSFIIPGRTNSFRIEHGQPNYPTWTMGFKNIQLLFEYTRPAPDPNFDEIPDLHGLPAIPKTDFAVNYNASITSGGGILVTAGQDQYIVNSKFSFPYGAFNRLKANGPYEGEWAVNIGENEITATGAKYKLERTIIKHPERIEVQDKLTNLTSLTLGIRLGHEVVISTSDIKKAYRGGILVPQKTGSDLLGHSSTSNPSVYVCKNSTGIGLLARDNVFRMHIGILLADGAYGLHDRYFALGANDSYSIKWDIYPTTNANYYDFINAARRAINSSFTIPGTLITARGMVGDISDKTNAEILGPINANNAKHVILDTIHAVTSAGVKTDNMAHGTYFSSAYGYWDRYWMERVIARYRQLAPNVKLIPYIQPFITSEPDALTTYPDSNPKRPDGSPQMYMEDSAYAPAMYPSWSNSYGIALDAYFDWCKEHADGFYIDTSTMNTDLEAGPFSYQTPNMWDGHSCVMSLGTGMWNEVGATYQITQTIGHSGLYTLDYRTSQIREAQQAGKIVWCNFGAATEDETQLHTLRFIEQRINNNPVVNHLGSAIGFGNNHWEMSESDIGRSIHMKLTYGGLFQPYVMIYSTNGNILQDMYPITPIELHCGYVMGTEKIITCTSGEFGFGTNSPMTVKIYNESGFWLPSRTATVRYDEGLGSTLANIVLNEGEMAIIFKQ